MPIDSVSSASPSPRSALAAARAGRGAVGAGGRRRRPARDRHQAAQAQPRQRGDGVRQRRHLGRRDAALARLAADVDLQAAPDSGGSCAGRCALSRSAIFSRSTEWTQSKCSATSARLVALQRPDQVPLEPARRSASAAILSSAFLHVVLAEARWPGGERFAHRRRRPKVLLTASNVTLCTGRPAAAQARAMRVVHLWQACLRSLRHSPQMARRRASAAPPVRPLPEDPWTSPNCWRFRSRTRPPTCTCRPACRR